ncbi:MAG: DUF2332 domain-containing protein [Chloroflexota bacterium]|nr:DUF2332 domain-containing protein [Chloroflexota bacterium]MDE2895307.1 DUF2332 domain-containing protein [Chloroflexota bacterium]
MSPRSHLDAPTAARYRDVFHRFARVEAPDLASPLYAELSYGVSLDPELLELAAQKRRHQPAPNMLFGAVQYLLLSGGDHAEHPLASHYPIVSGVERPMEPAFPAFRDFCLCHADEIVDLIRAHRTQTNVVRRCTCLLPAFSMVQRESGQPLALIDVGASAGLNLNVDRYRYRYLRGGQEEAVWGRPDADVSLEAELRGEGQMPQLAEDLAIEFRGGIDLNPIDLRDEDELRWLRALIWPEHTERHQRLIAAAGELARSPVDLRRGDAVDLLPRMIADTPREAALTVFSTVALYQIPSAGREQIFQTLQETSNERPVWLITLELRMEDIDEVQMPSLSITRYTNGAADRQLLARSSPHGWWIEWAA